MKSIKADVSPRQQPTPDSSSAPQPIRWRFVLRKAVAYSILSGLLILACLLLLETVARFGLQHVLEWARVVVVIPVVVGGVLWALNEVTPR